MARPQIKLPSGVEAILNSSGLPWSTKPCKKHVQILLKGKPITALPYRNADRQAKRSRELQNTLCAVRRAIREAK